MRGSRNCRFATRKAAVRRSPPLARASISSRVAMCSSTSTTSMPCSARSRVCCDRGGLFFFDTINRTWLSWLLVVQLGQEWLRLAPKGLHDWQMFITPAQLGASLARAGLELRDRIGLGPRLDSLSVGRALLHCAIRQMDDDDALALVGPTALECVLYAGWATTAPSMS